MPLARRALLEVGAALHDAHRVDPAEHAEPPPPGDEVAPLERRLLVHLCRIGPAARGGDPWNGGGRPYPEAGSRRFTPVVDLWLHDIESLEAVTQDEGTKLLCLRMAAMSKAGTLAPFIRDLSSDLELDADTRGTIAEIASDERFLLAVEDYVRRTTFAH